MAPERSSRGRLVASFVAVGFAATALLLLVYSSPSSLLLVGALVVLGVVTTVALLVALRTVSAPAPTADRHGTPQRTSPDGSPEAPDATELVDARSQLVRSEKMATLGELTAGIAHEINNPINFVAANVKPLQRDVATILELLRRYAELEPDGDFAARLAEIHAHQDELELDVVVEEIDQLIRGIDDGARRTAEIVRGLRSFSRADEAALKRVDLHEGIDSTLVLLHNTYRDRITVERVYGELPAVECYAGQLNQVFMNLLSNAVQSIDGDGRITIRTSREGDSVRIAIADTGAGIPAAIRERIFDPFFTTKDAGKGTGLGLSITREIVLRHGGTIDVESTPGGGTTFTLRLPIDHVQLEHATKREP